MLLNSNLSTAATTLTKWLVSIPSVSQTKGNSFITQSIYEGLSEFPYYKQHPQHLIQVPHADGTKSSIVALVKAIDEIEDTLVLLCNVDTNSPAHYGILKNISTQSDELERKLSKLAGDNQELKQKLEQHDALFGLGILESKCAAGCMLAAIKELSDNHVRANLNVILICTCDNAHQYQGLKHCIKAVQTLCQQEHLTLRLTLNAQPQLNNPTFANSSALFNVAANTVVPQTNDSEELDQKNQDLTTDQNNLQQSNASNALASLGTLENESQETKTQSKEQPVLQEANNSAVSLQEANQRMAAATLSKAATPELCLYTGNYGKIEPSFYILGQSTAVSQPFNGFSASLIAAELIHEFELNPKILQKLHQKPLIPTFDSLKVKDFGKEFSPDGVQLSFNLPILPAVDLSDVLELMKEIAADAIESAAEVVDEREAILAKINNQPFVPQTQDAEVISFSDLLERACSNYTGDMRQAVNSLIKKCKKEGFNAHQSAITIIERLNDFAQLPRPSIVVYFTDNLIPAQSLNANNYHDRELFMLLDNLMRNFAQETQLHAHMATHYAPTEVGFLRPESLEDTAALLEQESPVGFTQIPSLNVPTVTLGVLGGNLSQVSEYVEASMCQYLPNFVLQLVDTLATNPLSQSKAMQPQDDLQRHLDELGQKAEEIAAAALKEIRAVEKQSKEGSGFYTQVSQGTLSPSQLNYKDFRKNQLKAQNTSASASTTASANTTTVVTPVTTSVAQAKSSSTDAMSDSLTLAVDNVASITVESKDNSALTQSEQELQNQANATNAASITKVSADASITARAAARDLSQESKTLSATNSEYENQLALSLEPSFAPSTQEQSNLESVKTKGKDSTAPTKDSYQAEPAYAPSELVGTQDVSSQAPSALDKTSSAVTQEEATPPLNPEDMPAEAIPEVTKVVAATPGQEAQLLDQAQQKLKSALGSFKKFIHTGKEQLSKVKVSNILQKQTSAKGVTKDNIEPQLQLPHDKLNPQTTSEIDQALVAASAIAIAVNGNKTPDLVTSFSATDDYDINLKNGATESLVADADIFEHEQVAPQVKSPETSEQVDKGLTSVFTEQSAEQTTVATSPTSPESESQAPEVQVSKIQVSEILEDTESLKEKKQTENLGHKASLEDMSHKDSSLTTQNEESESLISSEQAKADQTTATDIAFATSTNVNKQEDSHDVAQTHCAKVNAESTKNNSKTAHTSNTTIVYAQNDKRFASEPQQVSRTMGIPEYEEEQTLSSNTRIVHSTESHVEAIHESLPTQDTIITGHELSHEVVSVGKSTTIITNNQPAFVSTREDLPPLHAEVKETPLSTILSPRVEQTAIKYETLPRHKATANASSETLVQATPEESNTQEVQKAQANMPTQEAKDNAVAQETKDKANSKDQPTLESKDNVQNLEQADTSLSSEHINEQSELEPQKEQAKQASQDKHADAKEELSDEKEKHSEQAIQVAQEEQVAKDAQVATAPAQKQEAQELLVAKAQSEKTASKKELVPNANAEVAPQKELDQSKVKTKTTSEKNSAQDSLPDTNNFKPMRNAEDALIYMMGEIDADFKVKNTTENERQGKITSQEQEQPKTQDKSKASLATQELQEVTRSNKPQNTNEVQKIQEFQDASAKKNKTFESKKGMSEETVSIMQSLTNIAMQYPEYHNAQEVMLQKDSLLKIDAKDSPAPSSLSNSLEQGLGSTYANTTIEGLALEKLDPAQAFAQLLGEIEKDDSAKNNFRDGKSQETKAGTDKVKSTIQAQDKETIKLTQETNATLSHEDASRQDKGTIRSSMTSASNAQGEVTSPIVQNNGNFVPPKESNFYGDLLPTEHPVRTRSLAPSVMGGSATLRTMKSMPAATVKPSAGKIRSSQLAAKRGGVAGVPGLAGAAGVLGTGDGRTTISDLNQPRQQNVRRGTQAIGGLNRPNLSTTQQHSVASNITSTLIDSRPTGATTGFNGMESAISNSIRSSGVQGKASPTPVNSQAKGNKGGLGPGVTQRRQPLKPDAGGNTKDYASLTTAMSAARLRNTKIRTPLKLNESGQAMVSSKSRDERRAALHKAMYGGLDEEVAVVNPVLGLGNKSNPNTKAELSSKVNRIEGSIKSTKSEPTSKAPPKTEGDDTSKRKGSYIAFDKGDFLNYDPSALRASFKKDQAQNAAQSKEGKFEDNKNQDKAGS